MFLAVTPPQTARLLSVHQIPEVSGLNSVYRVEQAAAALAIVLLAPLALVLATTIFLLSRRSPLVRHWRVGQYGAPLGMLKFRTMWSRDDPPAPFSFIEDVVSGSSLAVKHQRDARVSSRFAALCRRYSLDEIPQLLHVWRGEMSLVGPRPLTSAELRAWYGPRTPVVLSVRPGLTGLWQVMGRNRLTYPQRRRLDVFLSRRASASLYFSILVRTIPRLLQGDDAW